MRVSDRTMISAVNFLVNDSRLHRNLTCHLGAPDAWFIDCPSVCNVWGVAWSNFKIRWLVQIVLPCGLRQRNEKVLTVTMLALHAKCQ